MRNLPKATVVALFAALALVASACGSDGDDPGAAAATPASSAGDISRSDAAAAAAANTPRLASSDDVRLIEVLDVRSGEIATLADTVDGDRPVLIWFWAPF